jgi:hypothetical protein
MFETNSSLLATSGTATINGYSGTTINGNCGTTISGNSTLNTFSSLTVQNMRTKQVKVAVFTVERNDKNEVTSSKFVKELWVEVKNGASLELVVAKELDKDFDPANTIIREINSFSF